MKDVADLALHGNIANVYTGSVAEGYVGITRGRITCTGKYKVTAKEELDLGSKYILPGLIDAHLHIESSMLTPSRFAEAAVPRGTTCAVCDPHEIANVFGARGIEYMMTDSEAAPLRFYYMIPSCVPATNLETSGGAIDVMEIKKLRDNSRVLGLAEVMDYPGVVKGRKDIMKKIALCRDMVIDGHCPKLFGNELCIYVSAGIMSDHECTSSDEALEKLALGMHIMIREGSASRDLTSIAPAVSKSNSRRFMLVTDDLNPKDLLERGHMDYLLRRAVEEGLDPIEAVSMATLNSAEYFGLRDLGALAPGKKADLVVVDSLEGFTASLVLIDGKIVAKDGKPTYKAEITRPTSESPMNFNELTPGSLSIPCSSPEAVVRVIKVFEGQLYTKELAITLEAKDGFLVPNPEEDLLKVCVVERHRCTGNIGRGFARGFGLTQGALASSVAHDSHNVVVVGASDADMAFAANALRRLGGGLVVVKKGSVLASLPLPIGGLMTHERAEQTASMLDKVNKGAASLGCSLASPFSTLSFIALPVIPELKLTDHGLVDVSNSKLVDLVIQK